MLWFGTSGARLQPGSKNGFRTGIFSSRPHAVDQEDVSYRRLALQLHYDAVDGRLPRSVLITAPDGSAACAHATIGLACSLATELGRPVLLVDACSAAGSVTRLMADPQRPGLGELLANPALPLASLVLPTSHPNLSLLPAGVCPSNCPDSAVLTRALDLLATSYDFLVVAGGGALTHSLTRALAPHVGSVLLLGVENETRTDDLDAAQSALRFSNVQRLALVLTTQTRSR